MKKSSVCCCILMKEDVMGVTKKWSREQKLRGEYRPPLSIHFFP